MAPPLIVLSIVQLQAHPHQLAHRVRARGLQPYLVLPHLCQGYVCVSHHTCHLLPSPPVFSPPIVYATPWRSTDIVASDSGKDTLIFLRGEPDPDPIFFAVAFHSSDRVWIIDAEADVGERLEEGIRTWWVDGIRDARVRERHCREIRLRGAPCEWAACPSLCLPVSVLSLSLSPSSKIYCPVLVDVHLDIPGLWVAY
jgi:hypothetical protein